jgi:hypothetical protein
MSSLSCMPGWQNEVNQFLQFLGLFTNLQKVTALSCLSFHQPTLNGLALWNTFLWNCMPGTFIKYVEKIWVWLKSDKNIGHVTWRPKDMIDNILLNSFWKRRVFDKCCRENQNTHFVSNMFSHKNLHYLQDNY